MNRIRQLERYRRKNYNKAQDEIYQKLCADRKVSVVKPAHFVQRKSSKVLLNRFFCKVR